jgi:hypothetical protein
MDLKVHSDKRIEESLTERSKKFAQAALDYAIEHETDFPTAVRELMQITRQYEQRKQYR